MGLFDKLFKKKSAISELTKGYESVEPYVAEPQFYADEAGNPFGSFALTEDTLTLLPKLPNYEIDGKVVTDYRLALISISRDCLLSVVDYAAIRPKLQGLAIHETETHLLIPPLTLEQLEQLM